MKRIKNTLLLLVLLVSASQAFAQQDFKVETDNAGSKMLVGKLNLQLLANDSAFSWFYSGINKYEPNKEWTRYIQYYRDSFSVVVFAGTWETNTKNLLPALYRTLMAAGYPLNTITLYGVDQQMHALNGEAEKYRVRKLPTIIIQHEGQELGRIEAVPVQSVEANLVAILQTRFRPEGQPAAPAQMP